MSKSQSSNVDGRCDGDEMSFRDQKGRTRPLDRVEGSVSLEYIHSVETNLYTSDELSGKRMSWVGKVDNTASVSVGWPLSKIQNPPRYTQTKNYYEISWRTINFCCIDGLVYVWLSCIDCGCIESATSLRCDSNPVPQTNLGLTSLYSLLLFGWIVPVDWLPIGTIFAHGDNSLLVFNERTYRGVYMGSMLVAHHFLSRDFVLAFSNNKPMYTF